MSAYINMTSLADSIDVRYLDARGFAEDPKVVVRIDASSIHLDLDTARKLAEDILAALPQATEPALCPRCGVLQSRHTGGSVGPGNEWACYYDGFTPLDDDDPAVSA